MKACCSELVLVEYQEYYYVDSSLNQDSTFLISKQTKEEDEDSNS